MSVPVCASWGARVVYGDTDSLFVLLEGKSREQAFATGRDIARVVTAANPHPMELEMEKVISMRTPAPFLVGERSEPW